MPTEYFEQRERALLGERFDALYAAPQETAERGVTVSALRTTPEQFAAKADFSLEASPFCKAALMAAALRGEMVLASSKTVPSRSSATTRISCIGCTSVFNQNNSTAKQAEMQERIPGVFTQ